MSAERLTGYTVRVLVDVGRIERGKNQVDTAADHMNAAQSYLCSAEVSTGMFGRVDAAGKAEAVVSRTRDRHVRKLGDSHHNLTWIREHTSDIVQAFGETERANVGEILRVKPA